MDGEPDPSPRLSRIVSPEDAALWTTPGPIIGGSVDVRHAPIASGFRIAVE